MARPALTLRPALPEDAAALALIGAASFLDGFAETIPGPALIEHCRSQHSEAAYAGYLARTGDGTAAWIAQVDATGAPVGYALVTTPDLPVETRAGELELKRIYVLSRFFGGGAGQALMDRALAHARSRRAPRLLLGTWEGNHRAMAFYRRNGFETIGTRRFNVGVEVFDDIVMACRPGDG